MINNKKESEVINFGCRLNAYEAEIIKSMIKKNNIENTIVFNTCAVTYEAEKQIQQSIRRYHRNYPGMKIVVTGCAAQINPLKYKAIEGVSAVMGNNEKTNNNAWINLKKTNEAFIENIMDFKEVNKYIVESFDGKARAYVEIQQGCNHRCTFCIIPYGRGNNRSVPVELIIQRAKKLVSNGFNEIVLTGVDITDYGFDLLNKTSLSMMIKMLLKNVPKLKQLRLSSIDCAELDNDFWDLIKFERRLMPHLHISLQSGDDIILKRMKRRHSRRQALEFCSKARALRPNITFGADLIAGFPTENEKMFNNTCSLIDECDLAFLHIFPYSKRYKTAATKMPQIPVEIKKYRAKKLRNIGEKKLNEYLRTQVGKEKKFLVEKNFNNYSFGKTQEYEQIKINKKLTVGNLYNAKIQSIEKNILVS